MTHFRVKMHQLLRASERYTKTDMVYLAHGSFWLVLSQAVSAGASLLLAIIFANLLPKETFGTYKYILSLAALLAIPTLGGINTALSRAVAQGREGEVLTSFSTRLRWGLLGSAGSLAVAGYYYVSGNLTLALAFLILAFFIPLLDTSTVYEGLLAGRRRFDLSTKYLAIGHLLSILSITGTLFLTQNLFAVLVAYLAPWAIVRALLLAYTLKRYPANDRKDPDVLPYGKHLTLASTIGVVALQIDRILLFHYLGPAAVAVYTFATAIPEQLKGAVKIVAAIALPKFAMRDFNELRHSIPYRIAIASLVLLATTGLYILAAPYLYRLLFPAYTEAVFYSQLFALSLVAFLTVIPTSIFNAHKKIGAIYTENIASAAVQILLLLAGIYFFGLIGAIVARIVSAYFGFALSLVLLRRTR